MTNQESDFVVSRLVNFGRVAEGTSLPPRMTGSVRVPAVSRLEAYWVGIRDSFLEYIVTWMDPEGFTGSISHYEIWLTMSNRTEAPQGPYIARHSPAFIVLPRTYSPRPFVAFHVLTVLNNGMILPFDKAPTTTAKVRSVTSTSTGTDPGSQLPPPDPNRPRIVYFSALPRTSGVEGNGCLLQWSVENASSVYLDSTQVEPVSSTVVPYPGMPTVYTLTARNGPSTSTASLTLYPFDVRASHASALVLRYTGTAPSW